MNQVVKIAAVLAAVCVLTVLITPAFDELPGTVPHIFHDAITLPFVFAPNLFRTVSGVQQPDSIAARIVSGTDLLTFTCTRLC